MGGWIPVPMYVNGDANNNGDDQTGNGKFEWGGVILVGIDGNGMEPFQFEGSLCQSYETINQVLSTKQVSPIVKIEEELSLRPEKWMVIVAVVVKVLVSFTVYMSTCLVYIPSTVSTILKFRSGVFPSFKMSMITHKWKVNVTE